MDARQFREVGRARSESESKSVGPAGSRRGGRRASPRVEGLEARELLTGVVADVAPLPAGLTAGPMAVSNGALWFAENQGTAGVTKLGKMKVSGALTDVPLPGAPGRTVLSLVADNAGSVWYSAEPTAPSVTAATATPTGPGAVGRVATDGTVREFPVGAATDHPGGLAVTPDGTVWLAVAHDGQAPTIDKVAQDGTLTPVPAGPAAQVSDLTAGPDGSLWFVDGTKIGRMTAAGAVTEFPLTAPAGGTVDLSNAQLTVTSDGSAWFLGLGGISRITPAGVVTSSATPGFTVTSLKAGTDGNVWFSFLPPAGSSLASAPGAVMGRIASDGIITLLPDRVDAAATPVTQMAIGHDTYLWLDEGGGKVGLMNLSGLNSIAPPIIEPTTPTYVSVTSGQPFSGAIVSFAPNNPLPGSTPHYSAVITWGDGHVTPGTVTPNAKKGYDVTGANTYVSPVDTWADVQVTVQDGLGGQAVIFNRVHVTPPQATVGTPAPASSGGSPWTVYPVGGTTAPGASTLPLGGTAAPIPTPGRPGLGTPQESGTVTPIPGPSTPRSAPLNLTGTATLVSPAQARMIRLQQYRLQHPMAAATAHPHGHHPARPGHHARAPRHY